MPLPENSLRDRAAALVRDILETAARLEQALQAERAALERPAADTLADACAAKRAAVLTLERLEQARQALCREAGLPVAVERMPELFAACHAPPGLAADWQQGLDTLASAARLNAANGAVIHLRREQVSAALAIASGAHPDAGATYDAAGGRQRGPRSRDLACA